MENLEKYKELKGFIIQEVLCPFSLDNWDMIQGKHACIWAMFLTLLEITKVSLEELAQRQR